MSVLGAVCEARRPKRDLILYFDVSAGLKDSYFSVRDTGDNELFYDRPRTVGDIVEAMSEMGEYAGQIATVRLVWSFDENCYADRLSPWREDQETYRFEASPAAARDTYFRFVGNCVMMNLTDKSRGYDLTHYDRFADTMMALMAGTGRPVKLDKFRPTDNIRVKSYVLTELLGMYKRHNTAMAVKVYETLSEYVAWPELESIGQSMDAEGLLRSDEEIENDDNRYGHHDEEDGYW